MKATKSKKFFYLDLFRLLAMVLVMHGHFVGTGAYAYEIHNVIKGTLSSTIIDPNGFFPIKLDEFLYYKIGTQSAVLGVVMFFICTGYLVAGMMERYSPAEFLINRILRIFPCLAACTVCNCVVLFFSQGYVFNLQTVISTMTMTYPIFLIDPVMGVLWTLSVEILFYLYSVIIKKYNWNSVICLYGLIVLATILRKEFISSTHFSVLQDHSQYLCFCLLGVVIWLTEQNESTKAKGTVIIIFFSVNMIIFSINSSLFDITTTYPHFFTHLIPLLLFLISREMDKKEKKCRLQNFFSSFASMVFPIYLTHVVIGFTIMYHLRSMVTNRYLLLVLAIAGSIIIAQIIKLCVERPSITFSKHIISKLRNKVCSKE